MRATSTSGRYTICFQRVCDHWRRKMALLAAGVPTKGPSTWLMAARLSRMAELMNFPLIVFVLSFILMWLAAQIGARAFTRRRQLDEQERSDFNFIIGATLTLLGLIIGFSFSMAVGRYDQRKNYEEEEANAIGTEYVRTDLLPAASAQQVQAQLRRYLDLRIQFYEIRFEGDRLRKVDADTAQLQNEMWSAVKVPALANPTPVMALVVEGMNDVINRQGYSQAAWWNRIPVAAWGMMFVIAICCNLLLGFTTHPAKAQTFMLVIIPLVAAISFLLLADLDSPRGGIIRVLPQNLLSLAQSLHG
jgi:hypothetical protein